MRISLALDQDSLARERSQAVRVIRLCFTRREAQEDFVCGSAKTEISAFLKVEKDGAASTNAPVEIVAEPQRHLSKVLKRRSRAPALLRAHAPLHSSLSPAARMRPP